MIALPNPPLPKVTALSPRPVRSLGEGGEGEGCGMGSASLRPGLDEEAGSGLSLGACTCISATEGRDPGIISTWMLQSQMPQTAQRH
eukprot:2194877-Rhodomonas_salina.1